MALKKVVIHDKNLDDQNKELIKREKEEERIYELIIKELSDNIDLKKDSISLSILAQSINTINICNKEIEESGLTFVAGNDYRQVRPEVAIRNKAIATIIKLSSLFGMSPKDRMLMDKDAAKNIYSDEAGDDL